MNGIRLLTKSDFDGVVSAALLKSAKRIDDVVFVNNFDFESGKIKLEETDITCNLPYSDKVSLAFEYQKNKLAENHVSSMEKHSCSEIVYEYYKEELGHLDVEKINVLLESVNKSNRADFSKEEILEPSGFDMLNFLLDSRTGIGRIRAFKVSNYALMIKLVDIILEKNIDDILALDDVKERVEYYKESEEDYEEMLEFCAKEDGKILILDLRNETYVKPANRFVKFAMFPECEFAIQIMWGLKKMNTVFAVGKSIFNRNNEVDLEQLLKDYGGIARKNSGSIQVKSEEADGVLEELIRELS